MQTIEAETAQRLAHQDRVAATLARTGGEVMHPDHYDVREAFRLAVMAAIDEVTAERGIGRMSDGELPALFKAIDPIAERVWLKSVGL
jgi:hypothetical protein